MMRFTFLQLCAAEVPVPIPQEETERNLLATLKVDLYDSSWAHKIKTLTLEPKGHRAENYQSVADQLHCDAHLVIVTDDHWQKADLSGDQPRHAACALGKDAPMEEVFRQLMLTGLVADQLDAEPGSAGFTVPEHLKSTGAPFRLWESERQVISRRNNHQGTDVSFCASPFDRVCLDMAHITIQFDVRNKVGSMSVEYLEKGSTQATMKMSGPAGKLELTQGGKVVAQLSPKMQQKFRSLPKYMRHAAAPYLDSHVPLELPTASAQEKLKALRETLAPHARDL